MISYTSGSSARPLLGLTVGDTLDRAADAWPDRDALVVAHQDIRWSWRDLRQEAQRLAAGLLSLGLAPGDRVGLLAPNRAEWLVAQFGTAYAGLILVNINPAYRPPELEFALNKVGCRALITDTHVKTSDYLATLNSLAPELASAEPGSLAAKNLPALRSVITLGDESNPGMFRFGDLMARGTPAHLEEVGRISDNLNFDDPINIQFTSGTTGTPKAATLSHHNIVNNADISAELMRITEQDRLCVPVPMYHCFGMVLGTLLCATRGATVVFPSAGFDASASLRAIASERCTAVHGVPTMFIGMLDAPDFSEHDLGSLRTGIMAGAPCPIELMQRVMSDMHLAQITIGYGMTETGPLSTQTLPDDPIELRVGTVGRALPYTEIKVVDEHGGIVPTGEPGELCTRGYCVMRGYWDDPQKTSEEIDDAHWIRSGDIASMDESGYLRIVGRIKDMLIRGGENIYPREIEDFLYTHPKIEQVEVVGVPDPRLGEEIAACIRLREGQRATEEEIREFCRGEISHFKIPRYVVFVEEYPMTVTGKVQKFMLRGQLIESLGLGASSRGAA